ncbi:MAG: hypothetical protein JW953_18725 [Anaerolineae bacterium]|nr:hypothetical protein [Anaerolineae bacterium]
MPENNRPARPQGGSEKIKKKKRKTGPFVFQSLKRRDILILVTFWLTSICVVALVLGFFMLRMSDLSRPVYKITPGEVTARSLYPLAEAAARAWESDVQFVNASATWNHASMAALEQPVEWVYRFYSPGLQRILFVIVTPEQEVMVRPHLEKNRRETRLVNLDSWRMDSPAAITEWLNHGGGRWLQESLNPVVSAQLSYSTAENALVWTISGLNVETGQSIDYVVKAE